MATESCKDCSHLYKSQWIRFDKPTFICDLLNRLKIEDRIIIDVHKKSSICTLKE